MSQVQINQSLGDRVLWQRIRQDQCSTRRDQHRRGDHCTQQAQFSRQCRHWFHEIPLLQNGFRFRLDWQRSFLPRLPPADESAGLRPTRLLKRLRHTGARIFMRSSTVGNKPNRVRKANFCRLSGGPVGRHTDSAAGLQRARFVSLLRAHIEQNNRDITLPELT